MQRFDRLFGILLYLRGGRVVPAVELARRVGVSRRTIYRDLDALSAAGVPVYAERGRAGGIRLREGYFLPPLMFSRGEAIALLVGLTLLRGLRAAPYAAEIEAASRKLLAALPEPLRAALARLELVLGVERAPADSFHPEPDGVADASVAAGETVTTFLGALLDGRAVRLAYRSPYRGRTDEVLARPLALVWDRDRWYLVGRPLAAARRLHLWRADRVLAIAPAGVAELAESFDVRTLLDRAWLRGAMDEWRHQAPVELHLTAGQADLLRRDWYYRHAAFAPLPDGRVRVRFGERDQALVFALVHWLGPRAELVAPAAWRAAFAAEPHALLAPHEA